MNASVLGEKGRITIPLGVRRAAGLRLNDQVDWSFEEGEIRGRKLVRQSPDDVLEIDDLDPKTLLPTRGRITAESIVRSVRQDRDR